MRWGISLVLLGLFFVSFASAVIPDDCESSVVAYWKFDGDATEEINEYDGSLGGTAEVYGSAKVGEYSLGLSAGTDTFTIPDNLDLKPSGGLSIEFWIQTNKLARTMSDLMGDVQLIEEKGGRVWCEEIISKEDTIFLNQIGKDEINETKRCPPLKSNDTAPWKYSQ